MRQLGQQTESIGTVMTVINDITEATHGLAEQTQQLQIFVRQIRNIERRPSTSISNAPVFWCFERLAAVLQSFRLSDCGSKNSRDDRRT